GGRSSTRESAFRRTSRSATTSTSIAVAGSPSVREASWLSPKRMASSISGTLPSLLSWLPKRLVLAFLLGDRLEFVQFLAETPVLVHRVESVEHQPQHVADDGDRDPHDHQEEE